MSGLSSLVHSSNNSHRNFRSPDDKIDDLRAALADADVEMIKVANQRGASKVCRVGAIHPDNLNGVPSVNYSVWLIQ